MKLPELKQQLKPLDKNQLEKITALAYKAVPKAMKEDLDLAIASIIAGEDPKGSLKKTSSLNFDSLKCSIEEFIENANASNYIAPNRVVPKAQRSKWRFQVKNFIKELEKLDPLSPHYPQSVKLLKDLYILLCRACNYYLFSTDDPYQSIGMRQPELCYLVMNRMYSQGYTRESIREMIKLVSLVGLDRETLHVELQLILIEQLKDLKSKEIALEESLLLIEEREKELSVLPKYDRRRYSYSNGIEKLCNLQLILSFSLEEAKAGVANFFNHLKEDDEEISLYLCLDILSVIDEDEWWIYIYEDALKHNIEPREDLKRRYQERLLKSKE